MKRTLLAFGGEMKRFFWVYLFLQSLTTVGLSAATSHYVSPTGSGTLCTFAAPGTLTTAVSGGCPTQPGDTVNMRAGIYSAIPYTISISGTAANPITFQTYPADGIVGLSGSWAIVDSGVVAAGGVKGIVVNGSDITLRDFEVRNSNASVYNPAPGSDPANRRNSAIDAYGTRDKFIHLVVHDAGGGINPWTGCVGCELYGNIIYYTGWRSTDRGHGHSVYGQNETTTVKYLRHNIAFASQDVQWQMYNSGVVPIGYLNFDGNLSWDAYLPTGCCGIEYLIGPGTGPNKLTSLTFTNNYAYNPYNGYTKIGYGSPSCVNVSITNGYMVGHNEFDSCVPSTMTGNTFIGGIDPSGFQGQFSSNTYLANRPTSGQNIFVLPDTYESGRANVYAYNWGGASSVSVNLAGVLSAGDGYNVKYAGNPLGAAVATGTFGGSTITIPMTGYTNATTAEGTVPGNNLPQFGAYIVRKTGGGSSTPTASPTATKTGTPSWTATPTPFLTFTATPPQPTSTRSPTTVPISTPTSVPSPTPGPGQNLILEAESGALIAPMASASDPLASFGLYIASSTADAGTATFTVPAIASGATHYLWQRILCASSASDSFYVSLDGEADTAHVDDACEQAWSSSWQWRRVSDRALGLGVNWARPLSGGSHTVRFRGRDANTKLDEVALTTDPAWIPGSSPTATPTPVPPSATPTKTPTNTPTPTPATVCYTVTPGP